MQFLGTIGHFILTPLYWVISAILVGWHWVFSLVTTLNWWRVQKDFCCDHAASICDSRPPTSCVRARHAMKKLAAEENTPIVPICAQLEAELVELHLLAREEALVGHALELLLGHRHPRRSGAGAG